MQATKQKIKLKRTPLLRIIAVTVAVIIVGGLGFTVNWQVGNPISAWYTARKIAAHYHRYHPGEGYVVGPAKAYFADIEPGEEWKPHYMCNVYKTGSVDTGFTAVFQDNAVLQCEKATTKSGVNTYNRFKNALNAELAEADVRDALGLTESETLFADFYEPDITRDLFNPQSPVFLQDAPFDRDNLPLKSVACLGKMFTDVTEMSDDMLASTLYDLKNACEDAKISFDVYSVQIYATDLGYTMQAMDVPAAELATREKAAAYVASMEVGEKAAQSGNMYAIAVATRKMDWLYSKSQFEVCAH